MGILNRILGGATGGMVSVSGSVTSGNVPQFSGTSGTVLTDSGKAFSTDGTFASNSDAKVPTEKAVKTYADGLVVGLLDDRGNYDASVNTFPASGGSGTAGAILKGDIWRISVAGTLGGTVVAADDWLRALVDTPGQTAGNWSIAEASGVYVTGAASSTDNALVRFDLTTGKLVQNSVAILSDAGALSGLTQLDVDNVRVDGNTISSTDTNGNINLTPNGTGSVVSASPALFASGTAALPSIGWSDDADGSGTGFYRSAANLIDVTINGVQKLSFLDASGIRLKSTLSAGTTAGMYNNVGTAALTLSGGSNVTSGRNTVAYGETHSTKPGVFEVRSGTTVDLSMDNTGASTFSSTIAAQSLATSAATPLLLTNGQLVNVALTSQTVGATTLTIPDFANVVDEFTFKTKAQTMANKTLTAPVISTGLTASGSASNDFSASTGTFKTSSGANTLSGVVTIDDATTPSLTTAAGKTNTGFLQVNGKTSGAIKITAADAAAQTVTVNLAAQTVGAATLTIPNMANVNKTLAWLESPSFTTPALGTPSAGVLTNCTGLPVAGGGTGVASLTAYAPIFGGTTSTGAVQSGTVGTSGQVLTSNGAGVLPTFQTFTATFLPIQIILSNGTDANHDINFAAGRFIFSDSSGFASLSAIVKQADATWASGTNAGGMASGQTLPTSGTIHIFALSNNTGSIVDAGFDTSVSATNLIADSAVTTYFGGTPKFRRVGSLRTNGSANIFKFFQTGNIISLDVPVADISATPSTSRVNHTLGSIPSGIQVNANIFIDYNTGTAAGSQFGLLLNPALTDTAPSSSVFNLRAFDSGVIVETITDKSVTTNTSNQISSRFTDATGTLKIITVGWTDYNL